MATWTTIPDSSLEPGKPIRSIDTLALRDNPVAIAEGAAGAPKVQPEGMAFYPTQQGGGSGMLTNKIYIGWNGGSILGQVDVTPMGAICMSGYGVGAVGTYAFLHRPATAGSSNVETGGTLSGSNLRYAGTSPGRAIIGSAPSGTWRLMGSDGNIFSSDIGYEHSTSLWLRIA